jgi:hypothetical protein
MNFFLYYLLSIYYFLVFTLWTLPAKLWFLPFWVFTLPLHLRCIGRVKNQRAFAFVPRSSFSVGREALVFNSPYASKMQGKGKNPAKREALGFNFLSLPLLAF